MKRWKWAYEDPQGACWGLWDKNGQLKRGMRKVFNGRHMPDNWSDYGGPGNPAIEFTAVPPYGSFANLQGRVLHVDPAEYWRCSSAWVPDGGPSRRGRSP